MTKMLASVADLAEMEIAISGGADIIDFKDPKAGALGAVARDIVHQAVKAVAGRRTTSAVLGDLPMDPGTIRANAEEMAATGVDYVKVGFFPSPNAVICAGALAAVAARTKLIAVLFADREPDFGLLDVFARHGLHGVMIDTADKTRGRLLDHLPPERIPAFVDRARSLGLKVGLSGSLEAPDIPRLLPFTPDFLGFRGALCGRSRRTATISAEAVKHIRLLIPEERQADNSAGVDYRLLAARGYSPGAGDPTLGTDKIYVRDFVLPVHIGAYSFEHGHAQKVRFDVTAEVLRVTRTPEDMRHVFSYDIIMDGIRAIVARGHVELSETLAEHVAALLLDDPRVVRVTVRVEKLELGAGGVGVEIARERAGNKPATRPILHPEPTHEAAPGALQDRSHPVRAVVVKLGGSTADHKDMDVWIAALAAARGPLVVVPGGGPFADQVRDEQRRLDFSDAAAHAMAILAMDQFGHAILDRHERFSASCSLEEIEQTLSDGKIPVWLPSSMAIPASDIPASWDVTSDSLAAWLAGKLATDALLLIKQSTAFTKDDGIADLMAKGIVDSYLATMLPARVDLFIAGPHDAATAAAELAAGRLPGMRILRENPERKAG